MSVCRSCGAEVVWTVTTAGKRMPLDPIPSERGNVRIVMGVATVLSRAGVLAELARDEHTEFYMPHHATCPDGKQWRRPA